MARKLVGTLGLALAAGCLLAPGTAAARSVIVGPPDVSTVPGIFGEGAPEAATFMNVRLPDGHVRSPVTGTITRWRVNVYSTNFGTPSGFRLQVIRRTRNKPGYAGDVYEAVNQTPPETLSVGENVFEVSRPIREGDFIGLRYPEDSVSVAGLDGGRFLDFAPPLFPGEPGEKMDGERGLARHLLLNATVRK